MTADSRGQAEHQDVASFGIVDPMVIVDNVGRIMALNPAAQRFFGVKPPSVLGLPLETSIPQLVGDLALLDWSAEARITLRLRNNGSSPPRSAQVYLVVGADDSRIGRAIILSEDGCEMSASAASLDKRSSLRDQVCDNTGLSALVGLSSDVAGVLTHVAWRLGQTTDATSVYLSGWDPNLGISIVMAEYVTGHASPSERVSALGTCYKDAGRSLLEALEAGSHWIAHLEDASASQVERRRLEARGGKSALYIPFLVRGQLVGWAEIWESRRRREYSRRTVELAQKAACIAAVAIDKAQLYERFEQELERKALDEEQPRQVNDDLERRVSQRTADLAQANAELLRENAERRQIEADLMQRNRVLLSLQAAIASTTGSLDLEFLLDTITWELTHLLQLQSCTILQWDGRGELVTALGGGIGQEPSRSLDLDSAPLHRRVLEETAAIHLVSGQNGLGQHELHYLADTGARTLILLPMVFQGRTVGLVELMDRSADRVITDYEISAAQLLTSQAAAAIENARLYGHAQREIADRIRAEDRLRASLSEKEVLLKEIHHRVKNNLQVISSMISLQALGLRDPEALKAFEESQDRIRSMALIHEKLYRSEDLAAIDLSGYLEDLAGYLVRTYQRGERPVNLRIAAEGVRLTIDQAVPCGLIVNELVSNALKHAFPPAASRPDNSTSDLVSIELCREGQEYLCLKVEDNGVGIPEAIDFDRTDSLGLQIVKTLVGQLDGQIEVDGVAGAEFTITFPVPTG
jgi:two-component sensor histidine kinase